jgi:biopolymer transport protein ExbB
MGTHLMHWLSLVLAATPAESGGGFFASIGNFFVQGGVFMFVNLFWFACAVAVIVERIVTLMFRYNLNAPPFMEQVGKLVQTGNVDRAVRLCSAAPQAPLANVVRAGLERANQGDLEVAKAVEEAILEHTPQVQARISWLWSLANIATLVGLIGTIFGLIRTFSSLGNVPAEKKQELLSAGISEAMYNTAFGLSVAVICIIFHLFLTAYARRMVEVVELNALKLENLLSRRGSGQLSSPEKQAS